MSNAKRLSELLKLQAVLSIAPYPQNLREDFSIKGECVSEEYIIDSDPPVIGQYIVHGKVALTLMVRILPKPQNSDETRRNKA